MSADILPGYPLSCEDGGILKQVQIFGQMIPGVLAKLCIPVPSTCDILEFNYIEGSVVEGDGFIDLSLSFSYDFPCVELITYNFNDLVLRFHSPDFSTTLPQRIEVLDYDCSKSPFSILNDKPQPAGWTLERGCEATLQGINAVLPIFEPLLSLMPDAKFYSLESLIGEFEISKDPNLAVMLSPQVHEVIIYFVFEILSFRIFRPIHEFFIVGKTSAISFIRACLETVLRIFGSAFSGGFAKGRGFFDTIVSVIGELSSFSVFSHQELLDSVSEEELLEFQVLQKSVQDNYALIFEEGAEGATRELTGRTAQSSVEVELGFSFYVVISVRAFFNLCLQILGLLNNPIVNFIIGLFNIVIPSTFESFFGILGINGAEFGLSILNPLNFFQTVIAIFDTSDFSGFLEAIGQGFQFFVGLIAPGAYEQIKDLFQDEKPTTFEEFVVCLCKKIVILIANIDIQLDAEGVLEPYQPVLEFCGRFIPGLQVIVTGLANAVVPATFFLSSIVSNLIFMSDIPFFVLTRLKWDLDLEFQDSQFTTEGLLILPTIIVKEGSTITCDFLLLHRDSGNICENVVTTTDTVDFNIQWATSILVDIKRLFSMKLKNVDKEGELFNVIESGSDCASALTSFYLAIAVESMTVTRTITSDANPDEGIVAIWNGLYGNILKASIPILVTNVFHFVNGFSGVSEVEVDECGEGEVSVPPVISPVTLPPAFPPVADPTLPPGVSPISPTDDPDVPPGDEVPTETSNGILGISPAATIGIAVAFAVVFFAMLAMVFMLRNRAIDEGVMAAKSYSKSGSGSRSKGYSGSGSGASGSASRGYSGSGSGASGSASRGYSGSGSGASGSGSAMSGTRSGASASNGSYYAPKQANSGASGSALLSTRSPSL